MNEFANKTALVTGAGRNIGRAIALAFADAGSNVGIIVHKNQAEAESVAEEVRKRGVRAAVAVGDIGDATADERMVATIVKELGDIDYLVNNAARRPMQSFLDISLDDWNGIIASNLSSIFYLSRLVLPSMVKRGFGRIITIGGPDGVVGFPNRAHNVTAKAGLIGLTKAIALEFGDKGITANIVMPGPMDTTRDPKHYPFWGEIKSSLVRMREEGWISIPRLGTCEELAHAVMFLAAEKSAYLTMQQIYVTGGMAGLP
jgi:3-oxoacyl-[acyl-carrier protein] reductase